MQLTHMCRNSLVMPDDVPDKLLRYMHTAMQFSDRGVNATIVAWNRVILVHGEPGMGKSSLCKALAHKLAIRLGDRYRAAQLVEINAHSLFSKYFSESGKLVMRLFAQIEAYALRRDTLLCLLIGTRARDAVLLTDVSRHAHQCAPPC